MRWGFDRSSKLCPGAGGLGTLLTVELGLSDLLVQRPEVNLKIDTFG